MPEIYKPEEDSFLLSKVLEIQIPKLLKQNKNLTLLEIGCGSGIQLETALKLGIKKQNIFSCDINLKAVNYCKNMRLSKEAFKKVAQPYKEGRLSEGNRRCLRGFNCIQSDLFQNIHGKYNLIIFNPPYLPEDKKEPKDSRIATTGGKKGSEIINKFLKQAKDYLKKGGKIFLLTSSLTKGINFLNYKKKLLEKEKLFFEELYVWELRR